MMMLAVTSSIAVKLIEHAGRDRVMEIFRGWPLIGFGVDSPIVVDCGGLSLRAIQRSPLDQSVRR